MMRERAHRRDARRLLAAAHAGRRDEEAGVLAPEGAAHPLAAGPVPEGLELRGKVAVPRRDAEQERVELFQFGRVVQGLDGRVFGGRVHLGEDLFREGFGDSGGWVSFLSL